MRRFVLVISPLNWAFNMFQMEDENTRRSLWIVTYCPELAKNHLFTSADHLEQPRLTIQGLDWLCTERQGLIEVPVCGPKLCGGRSAFRSQAITPEQQIEGS